MHVFLDPEMAAVIPDTFDDFSLPSLFTRFNKQEHAAQDKSQDSQACPEGQAWLVFVRREGRRVRLRCEAGMV
jgi:hypothetical protein